tara:strand:- start:608 stop:832 length:225 start_codon:yes stop_codon:yes gene_type:complete
MVRIGTLEHTIVTGNCPECRTDTLLVSFEPGMFRCVNCGHDLEQKINGVIRYVIADTSTAFKLREFDDDGKEKA